MLARDIKLKQTQDHLHEGFCDFLCWIVSVMKNCFYHCSDCYCLVILNIELPQGNVGTSFSYKWSIMHLRILRKGSNLFFFFLNGKSLEICRPTGFHRTESIFGGLKMYRDYNFLSVSVWLSDNQISGQAGRTPLAKEKSNLKQNPHISSIDRAVQSIIIYFYNSQLLPCHHHRDKPLLKSLHSSTNTEWGLNMF